jgi:hypothetical protein
MEGNSHPEKLTFTNGAKVVRVDLYPYDGRHRVINRKPRPHGGDTLGEDKGCTTMHNSEGLMEVRGDGEYRLNPLHFIGSKDDPQNGIESPRPLPQHRHLPYEPL